MDKLRKALSGNEQSEEESSIMSQVMNQTSLSWSTRIKGFLICFAIGIIFNILGCVAMFTRQIAMFAVFYSFGNIISLASTCFLMGPMSQLKKMFASTRIVATILVIFFLAMTLIAALLLHKPPLAFIFIILQSLAMTWYSLSYIPYARDAVKKTVEACIT